MRFRRTVLSTCRTLIIYGPIKTQTHAHDTAHDACPCNTTTTTHYMTDHNCVIMHARGSFRLWRHARAARPVGRPAGRPMCHMSFALLRCHARHAIIIDNLTTIVWRSGRAKLLLNIWHCRGDWTKCQRYRCECHNNVMSVNARHVFSVTLVCTPCRINGNSIIQSCNHIIISPNDDTIIIRYTEATIEPLELSYQVL